MTDKNEILERQRRQYIAQVYESFKILACDDTVGGSFKDSDLIKRMENINEPKDGVEPVAVQVQDVDGKWDELFEYPDIGVEYDHKHCREIFVESGTTFVKSYKGSGKTHQLIDFLEYAKRMGLSVLLIGHLKNLLSEMADKMGMDYYEDMTPKKRRVDGRDDYAVAKADSEYEKEQKLSIAKMRNSKCLAICMNSLWKLVEDGGKDTELGHYDVVMIDESEQVLRTLGVAEGTITGDKRRLVINAFMKIVGNAEQLIMLDADLSELSVNIAHNLRGSDKVSVSINTHKVPGRELTVWDSRDNMDNQMFEDITNGKSIFYTCSSNDKVHELETLITDMDINHKVTIISSNNSGDADIKNYIKLLNTAEKGSGAFDGHVVLATPSLGTGVDISAEFDVVYGAFGAGMLTHYDIDQQLARVRNPGKVNVWVQSRTERNLTEPNAIEREYVRVYHQSCKANKVLPKTVFAPWEDFFMYLNTMSIAVSNASKNQVKVNFIEMKEAQSWVVHHMASVKEDKMFNTASAKMKNFDKYVETLQSVDSLNKNQYDRLSKKREKTFNDKMVCERFAIENFWKLNIDDDPQIIDWSVNKKLDSIVRGREFYSASERELSLMDVSDIDRNMIIDHKHRVLRHRLLKRGLKVLGIVDGADIKTLEFAKDYSNVVQFIDWCQKVGRDRMIKEVLDLQVNGKRATDQPVMVVEAFIAKAGYLLDCGSREQVNGKRVRIKKIDAEMEQLVVDAIVRREDDEDSLRRRFSEEKARQVARMELMAHRNGYDIQN